MEPLCTKAVEYNLTEHCNLNCFGCNHAAPLFPHRFASLDAFERDLEAFAAASHVEELRLVGGEPLLHPRVVDFLRIARSVRVADRVVLYTNGLLLHEAPRAVWENVDELWVSLYQAASRRLSLGALQVIAEDCGVRLRPYEVNSFTLTLLNTRIADPALVHAVYGACELAHGWSCHPIYEGRYFKCAQAPFLEHRLSRLDLHVANKTEDGIDLYAGDLRSRLERYLANDTPLIACQYCLGTSGPLRPHRLVGARGREEWLREDHRRAIAQTAEKLIGRPSFWWRGGLHGAASGDAHRRELELTRLRGLLPRK